MDETIKRGRAKELVDAGNGTGRWLLTVIVGEMTPIDVSPARLPEAAAIFDCC